MTQTEYLIIAAIFYSTGFVVSHIVFVRWYVSKRQWLSAQVMFLRFFATSFVVGYCAFSWAYLYSFSLEATEFFAATIIFCILTVGSCYVYFHIYNMSQTATRIRILVDLLLLGAQSKNVAIDNEATESDMGVQMIENRIDRLQKMGQLAMSRDGTLTIKSGNFLFIGSILGCLGKVVAGKSRYEA